MGSKKTVSVKQKTAPKKKAQTKAAPRAAKKEKTAAENKPRHPKGRVSENGRTKEALAKTLASALAHADEDSNAIETRLKPYAYFVSQPPGLMAFLQCYASVRIFCSAYLP